MGVGLTVAVGVGGVTSWGANVGAGRGVGNACAGACVGADVAVGKGANVGTGVATEGISVAEEAPRAGTGGVASRAATVACARVASVT